MNFLFVRKRKKNVYYNKNNIFILYIYQYVIYIYNILYINIYILGFEMALKKIKTEKKNQRLIWYFTLSYTEFLLHA